MIGAFVLPPEMTSFLRLLRYPRDDGSDLSHGEIMTSSSRFARFEIHGSITSTG